MVHQGAIEKAIAHKGYYKGGHGTPGEVGNTTWSFKIEFPFFSFAPVGKVGMSIIYAAME